MKKPDLFMFLICVVYAVYCYVVIRNYTAGSIWTVAAVFSWRNVHFDWHYDRRKRK